MLVSKTKQKLRDGKPVFGIGLHTNDVFIADIIGKAGFDYILIDGQHGPLDPRMLYEMVNALGATESDVVVRVAFNEPWMIGQALDFGADGVIVPLVDSAADVRKVVDAAKYPPMGSRSSGPRKVWRLGGFEDYLLRANEETIVWPQIETAGALEDIDEFLEVEGIDGIMIGPSDLSYALGNQPPDLIPQADETVQFILDKCKEHGVPWGMFSGLEAGEKWIRRGGQIITTGGDLGHIAAGAARDLAKCQEIEASL